MEPDFEIEGRGIDTSALQEELARRVEERKKSGVYDHGMEAALAERLPEEPDGGSLTPLSALDYAATRSQRSWEVTTTYQVDTDKSFARPLIIVAKRLARFWARIAVGPVQREQTAFNRDVAVGLEALKRQAVLQRAEAMACEKDLAELSGSMVDREETDLITGALGENLGTAGRLLAVGPCPPYLVDWLSNRGFDLHLVSPGTAWDEVQGGPAVSRAAPLAFLAQVAEESAEAALICDLAFWLKPETLIRLTRRAYLVLKPGGRLAVVVHSFAAGAPAPAWCAAPVLTAALQMAGFTEISIARLQAPSATGADQDSPSGYIAVAGKPER